MTVQSTVTSSVCAKKFKQADDTFDVIDTLCGVVTGLSSGFSSSRHGRSLSCPLPYYLAATCALLTNCDSNLCRGLFLIRLAGGSERHFGEFDGGKNGRPSKSDELASSSNERFIIWRAHGYWRASATPTRTSN
jgi:hypothetical protein